MRHLFVMLVVAVMGFGLAVDHAEARRMGGGKSFGNYSRSAAPQQSATPPRTAQSAAGQRQPSSGLSRFAGPLAGMLAGGLLASLFFGGAFDELRLLDMLLLAGAAFLLFRLFARRRRTAMAGAGPAPQATPAPESQPQAFQASAPLGGGLASEPAWFDRERFLGGAKEHFMTLQRAWDNNDFAQIQDYVTPELYNLLKAERAEHPANNRTEIVRLFAELGSIREVGSQAEASVLFHGIISENGTETEFNETWHLIRELRDDAPWYVQGIEQNPTG